MATNIIDHANMDNKQTAAVTMCPLCCEEDLSAPTSSRVTLSSCNHECCKTCLVKWIEKEEASGQTTPPTCPFCRLAIGGDDVLAILGRTFQPRKAVAKDLSGEDDIDDLTLQWMNEQTKLCGGCGSRVEKSSGCDLIECLCGYRFCFACGSPGGCCNCNNGHGFLNNRDGSAETSPIRDAFGRVDLRSTILQRRVKQEREWPSRQRHEEEDNRWIHSDTNAAVCTANGRWLFSNDDGSRCIRMLSEQLSYTKMSSERSSSKRSRQKNDPTPSTSIDISWMFVRAGAEARVLRQLLAKDSVQRSRKRTLQETADYQSVPRIIHVDWLFLPKGADIQVLLGMKNSVRKHLGRVNRRNTKDEAGEITEVLTSGAWLFKATPGASLHLLVHLSSQVTSARNKRNKRARARENNDDVSVDGIQVLEFIRGGAWLFRLSSITRTVKHLARLYKHWENAEQVAFQKMIKDLFSSARCNKPDCANCGGTNRKMKEESENEKENLENMSLLFPGQYGYDD